MAASDWAELMGDSKQPAGTEEKQTPAPRASSKAPPPGFEKPLDADKQPATAGGSEDKPAAAAAAADSKSFGGGNAALAALMGSAPPATAAVASPSQVCHPVLYSCTSASWNHGTQPSIRCMPTSGAS